MQWLVENRLENAGTEYRAIVDADGHTICSLLPKGESHAQLIAAAPDLLAALSELLPLWENGIEEPWIIRARAAVAKACAVELLAI